MIHNHFTSVASFTFPDFTWWMYSRFAEAELGVDLRKLLVLLPMWVSFVTGALCGANLKAIPSQCYLYFSNLLTALGPALAFLALFNQIYEYLRYLSKTLKLGMLFLEGIRTDRTVRRKTCLKNWRSSERHLFEVPLLNVFWASMLCSFQLSPPHSLDWYTWLWGSVFLLLPDWMFPLTFLLPRQLLDQCIYTLETSPYFFSKRCDLANLQPIATRNTFFFFCTLLHERELNTNKL